MPNTQACDNYTFTQNSSSSSSYFGFFTILPPPPPLEPPVLLLLLLLLELELLFFGPGAALLTRPDANAARLEERGNILAVSMASMSSGTIFGSSSSSSSLLLDFFFEDFPVVVTGALLFPILLIHKLCIGIELFTTTN